MLVASRTDLEQAEEPVAPPRRAYYVTPAIAVATLVVTLAWGSAYGMGLRDPDGIIGWRFSFVLMLVAGFWALDVIPRGILAARRDSAPTWGATAAIAR